MSAKRARTSWWKSTAARRCRDRPGRARLQQGRTDSRLPPGQGAGAGGQAAVPQPDSARRGRTSWCRAPWTTRCASAGLEPLDTPDIRDVVVEEGQPLKFTATFDTVPSFDSRRTRRCSCAGRRRRCRRARSTRRCRRCASARRDSRWSRRAGRARRHRGGRSGRARPVVKTPDTHQDVTIEIGAAANPPGFDDEVIGIDRRRDEAVRGALPDDYEMKELAGTAVNYTVTIKGLKRRVVPELDDEFARDLGEFDTLAAFRARVEQDLTREAEQKAERDVRGRPAEAAGRVGDLHRAGVAHRPGAGPAYRGLRPPADGAGGRSAKGRHRLGGVPAGAAGRRARQRGERAGARRGRPARGVDASPSRKSRPSCRGSASARGGRRRRSARSSRRMAASPGWRPGCGGRRRLTF